MNPNQIAHRFALGKWHFPIRNYGFTLIEMLVVIAIISILAAMLMPALQKAGDMAKSVSCTGNQRQIGFAFASYTNDNNGSLPPLNAGPSYPGFLPRQWWVNLLSSYAPVPSWYNESFGLTTVGVWRCPSVTDDTMIKWGGGYGVLENSTHGFGYGVYPILRRYQSPSRRMMMADCQVGSTGKTFTSMHCPQCHSWATSTRNELSPRHNGSEAGNVLFYDGHMASRPYIEMFSNADDIFGHSSL